MGGERGRLAPHSLHHAAVAAQRKDVVIEQIETRSVEMPRQPVGRDRHPDAGRNPLAERARRRLDTRGQVVFRMTRTLAVELAKALQIIERDRRCPEPLVLFVYGCDAGHVQHRIEQGRGVAGGQHETVAVRPDRILGIETQEFLPQRVDHRRHRHRRSRVPGFGLLNRVDAQGADGVDTDFVDRTARRHHVFPLKSNRAHCGDCTNRKRTPAMPSTISSIG